MYIVLTIDKHAGTMHADLYDDLEAVRFAVLKAAGAQNRFELHVFELNTRFCQYEEIFYNDIWGTRL